MIVSGMLGLLAGLVVGHTCLAATLVYGLHWR